MAIAERLCCSGGGGEIAGKTIGAATSRGQRRVRCRERNAPRQRLRSFPRADRQGPRLLPHHRRRVRGGARVSSVHRRWLVNSLPWLSLVIFTPWSAPSSSPWHRAPASRLAAGSGCSPVFRHSDLRSGLLWCVRSERDRRPVRRTARLDRLAQRHVPSQPGRPEPPAGLAYLPGQCPRRCLPRGSSTSAAFQRTVSRAARRRVRSARFSRSISSTGLFSGN